MYGMYDMYSMGMMNPMYGMYGMGNMYGSGVNIHQTLKSQYGVGYEDFGKTPYAQPYPMAVIPRRKEHPVKETGVAKFLKNCFV